MNAMNIAHREIGPGHPAFVVAEIGPNHAGSLERARRLVHAAADAGADAVKLQTYRPEDLTVDSDHPAYVLTDGPWAGRRLWDLYAEAMTPWEWHEELFDLARERDLIAFSSVFSADGLAFLESLDCPAYKVASAEVADVDFVRTVAKRGRPVMLSDGMADIVALWDAAFACVNERADGIWLRCVSDYPARAADYRLPAESQTGPPPWGLSDHTTDSTVAVAAVALGASVVEKHLMLDPWDYDKHDGDGQAFRDWAPLDARHSVTPGKFASYVDAIRATEAAVRRPHPTDRRPTGFRRRLVFARDRAAGAVVGERDVRTARCGAGLEPDARGGVVGARLARDVAAGEPATAEALDAVTPSGRWGLS